MTYSETHSQKLRRGSTTGSDQAALTERLERDSEELRWLVQVIVGNDEDVDACIEDAARLAETGGYAAPEWVEHWVRRSIVRCAVDRVRAEIQRVSLGYSGQSNSDVAVLPLRDIERVALRSIAAERICENSNALERSALVMHGYLGFSVLDCALMLGCHRSVIEPACASALRRIFGPEAVVSMAGKGL
jgi:DNA-directed RNA polymerase specialized sigma24 family protein